MHPLLTTRVFLFDRWLEIDRENQQLRIVPFRLPSVLTGITMLAIPAALVMSVWSGERTLTTSGLGFVLCYSALAVAFMVMPFARSNSGFELDLRNKVARRRGAETPLSAAELSFVSRERRGEAFATVGGERVRFLYLANDFVEIARLVVHAAAAGIRGEPEALLRELTDEAKRHEWKAYVVHLMLPVMMVGAGAVFYWLYRTRG